MMLRMDNTLSKEDSPHLVRGFFKTLGNKVNLLKCSDLALLIAGHCGVKWKDVGLTGQSMLIKERDMLRTHLPFITWLVKYHGFG